MIILVSPGVTAVPAAGGGAAFFRGVAEAVTEFTRVLAVGPSAQDGQLGPDLWEKRCTSVEDVLEVLQRESPEAVLKAAGALGGDDDRRCDLALLDLHLSKVLPTLIYVDADAASRLPVIAYQPNSYIGVLGAAGVPVLVLGGGPRALHLYRGMGFERVVGLSTSIAWSGLQALLASIPAAQRVSTRDRDVDLCSLIAPRDPRKSRERSLVLDAANAGLSTAVAADRSHVRLEDWMGTLSHSLMCLNIVRDDVSGYPDIASARVFEAVSAGCLLISDDFPGLSSLVPPPYRLALPSTAAEWRECGRTAHRDGRLMARGARLHVESANEVAKYVLVKHVKTWMAHGSAGRRLQS